MTSCDDGGDGGALATMLLSLSLQLATRAGPPPLQRPWPVRGASPVAVVEAYRAGAAAVVAVSVAVAVS